MHKGMRGTLMAAQDGWLLKSGTAEQNTRHGTHNKREMCVPEISRTEKSPSSSLALVVKLGLNQQGRV
jgi:hypothetical protein